MAIDIKNDKIIITRTEAGIPKMEVEGLWSGKDRARITRMLFKETMRAMKKYKRDLANKQKEEEKKQKKIEILAKARAVKAKKAKNKEEVKDNG